MKLDLVEALEHANGFAKVVAACPRAAVATYLYDREGYRRGRASNTRFDGRCDCNDGVDTRVEGSATCCAQHSEVRALIQAAKEGWYPTLYLALVTRPPCRNCITYMLESPLEVIVTSDEYPDRDATQAIWERFGKQWVVLPHKAESPSS